MAQTKSGEMSAAQKAALTRKPKRAGKKAALTRKRKKTAQKAVETRKKRALGAAAQKAWEIRKEYWTPIGEADEEEEFEDVSYWWVDAQREVELNPAGMRKLRDAFFIALAKMPREALDTFLSERPHIICNSSESKCMRYVVTVPPELPEGQQLPIKFIYIRYDLVGDEGLINYVAHEIAHIVRGDHKTFVPTGEVWKSEKAADDLSDSWGFSRIYSEEMLDKLKNVRPL